MKRREFLRISGLTIPLSIHGLSLSALTNNGWSTLLDNDNDRVLVLIQLNGGNDGLNTLLPMDQYDNLQQARPDLIIPENDLLMIDQDLGFHPTMSGFKELYDQQLLSIVQGVAYPDQNRSHFRSTDIWTTASSASEVILTGWLGRYLDSCHSSFPDGYPNDSHPDPFALTAGYFASETCQGSNSNFSLAINSLDNLYPLTEGEEGESTDTPYGMELDYIRQSIRQTNQYTSRIIEAADQGTNAVTYTENNPLAQALKSVSRLISGGLQTKVYVVSIGGFDTHADQIEESNPTEGEHATLLHRLSDAVFSFQQDLEAQGLAERVMGMTFSEFGRQIAQNQSMGTDHGTAAPVFFFGNCVGGQIVGHNDIIPDQVEPQEGVAMQYEFRDIYGTVLIDWLGAAEDQVRDLIHTDFVRLSLFDSSCLVTNTSDLASRLPFVVLASPNPAHSWVYFQLDLDVSCFVDLRIYDSIGREVELIVSQNLAAGPHRLSWNCSGAIPGNYYYRTRTDHGIRTQLLVVV